LDALEYYFDEDGTGDPDWHHHVDEDAGLTTTIEP
jgi:hypothetical protein